MKKVLLIIITIMLMITPGVNALTFYENVNISTSFSEEIDINSINKIYITLEDATQEEKVYTLKKEDGFSLALTNIAAGTLKFDYGIVDNDKTGKYKITGNVSISTDLKIATINILVENQSNTKYDHDLSDEVLDIIHDNKKTTTTTTTTKVDNNETEIIIGDNNSTTTTSTTTRVNNEAKEKQLEENEQNRKKNDVIGIIIFSILGIIILIGLIYVIVKISKANK